MNRWKQHRSHRVLFSPLKLRSYELSLCYVCDMSSDCCLCPAAIFLSQLSFLFMYCLLVLVSANLPGYVYPYTPVKRQ